MELELEYVCKCHTQNKRGDFIVGFIRSFTFPLSSKLNQFSEKVVYILIDDVIDVYIITTLLIHVGQSDSLTSLNYKGIKSHQESKPIRETIEGKN